MKITSIITIIVAAAASASASVTARTNKSAVPTTNHLLTKVLTNGAPKPIGAYAQGIKVGNMLYVSGEIPLDPVTGLVVAGGMKEQATRSLESLRAIIEASGSEMGKVVKTTVFLSSLTDYETFNAVYTKFFGKHTPARSTVQVAGIPKGVMIEIEAIVRL